MSAGEKKRYALLFFVLPKKSSKELVDIKRPKHRSRTKHWVAGGIFVCFLVVVYYYRDFVISVSNRFTEYFTQTYAPNVTSPEVRHIGFLKVHKAGGSSVQNVLFRFGLKRHLSFIMPTKDYKFSTYGHVHVDLINNKNGCYDILALHSVFNKTTYSQVLPSDAVYIAIVREPLSLMISGAYYHRDVSFVSYLRRVPKENYIQNLIRYPERYDPNELSLTRNSMAMDFGFPKGFHVTDTERVQNYLSYLDKQFQFVMIMERFDESMVFLRRLLNWKFEDILYIPLNANQHKSAEELQLSNTDRKKFEERNFLDVAIYKHFKNIFLKKLSVADSEFFAEVDYFKTMRTELEEFCSSHESAKSFYHIEESRWNSPITVTHLDCDTMKMPELKFIDKIRQIEKQGRSR
ncbi:Galactose-3-O-sulfotransferase [Mactra antiquata]